MPENAHKEPLFNKKCLFFKKMALFEKSLKPQNARKCTQGTTFLQKMSFFWIFQKQQKTPKNVKKREKTAIFSEKTSKMVIFSEKSRKNAQKSPFFDLSKRHIPSLFFQQKRAF